jgi:Fur family ferric uptake transcriptional regulator
MHTTIDFTTLLHQHGRRVTPQRQMILDAIREGGGHSTPEEILQRVHTRSTAINTATVYRNLNFLVEMYLVMPCNVGGHRIVYEIAGTTPHHHLICHQCGRISTLPHTSAGSFFAKIAEEQGFIVETNHLALFGLCSACQAQENNV